MNMTNGSTTTTRLRPKDQESRSGDFVGNGSKKPSRKRVPKMKKGSDQGTSTPKPKRKKVKGQ